MDKLIEATEMQEVDESLALGIPRELALRAAGIDRERMHQITQQAKEGDRALRMWLQTLEQTEARAKVEHLKKVAESPDWRAREKMLLLSDPSLLDGSNAEHRKTYDWMLRVISEETDEATFERILTRFAVEDPGYRVEGSQSEGTEAKLH